MSAHNDCSEPIHHHFGLSYANYLVLPRSVLQSMPEDWQAHFVGLLEEMERAAERAGIEFVPTHGYWVRARGASGSFIHDPFGAYDRGRRDVFRAGERVRHHQNEETPAQL